MPLVFVYGTLKRAQCNAHVMQGARFVATAQTARPWRLVALAHYPALVREEGGGAPVSGEVWDVPAAMMAMLDRFEEVPDLYTREAIGVVLADRSHVQAQAYFMTPAQAAQGRDLPAGCWPD